jgi:predicted dehydrogenase
MRRDGSKAEDYARRHNVPKWYSDGQQLIDDPDVNAIYIATPPGSHEEYTLRALAANKPVYVEKPMSTNAAAAERMLQASIKAGVKLCVAHYRKAQPRFKKLKALLEAKEIGTVRLVNLQLFQPPQSSLIAKTDEFWRVDPAISGGGLFHDLSPHQLDLMQFFFGNYKRASGFSINQGGMYAANDLTVGSIMFESGVVFNGSWCFMASKGEEKDLVEIVGSDGKISFTTFSTHHVSLSKNGNEEVLRFPELEHVQQPMIDAVVQYFLGEGPNPSSAESAVETMRIIDSFAKPLDLDNIN